MQSKGAANWAVSISATSKTIPPSRKSAARAIDAAHPQAVPPQKVRKKARTVEPAASGQYETKAAM
jgi:hypothetical protein